MKRSAAQTEINEKLSEINKIIKECHKIAQKEGITFVPISALFLVMMQQKPSGTLQTFVFRKEILCSL